MAFFKSRLKLGVTALLIACVLALFSLALVSNFHGKKFKIQFGTTALIAEPRQDFFHKSPLGSNVSSSGVYRTTWILVGNSAVNFVYERPLGLL